MAITIRARLTAAGGYSSPRHFVLSGALVGALAQLPAPGGKALGFLRKTTFGYLLRAGCLPQECPRAGRGGSRRDNWHPDIGCAVFERWGRVWLPPVRGQAGVWQPGKPTSLRARNIQARLWPASGWWGSPRLGSGYDKLKPWRPLVCWSRDLLTELARCFLKIAARTQVVADQLDL